MIKTNPFGFLPSNLSQLFHYVDFKSIERLLNLREITKLKARYDDYKGVFELLVFANNNKHYYAINKNQENNNSLKRNLDFYQYIYDRSFELNINLKQWFDNEDLNSKDRLKKILGFTSGSGTAWVIDRIKNNQDNDHYELLLATNMHVFNFRNTFDKSLHVHNKGIKEENWDTYKVGFYDGTDATSEDTRNQQIHFKTNHTREKLDENFGNFEFSKNKYENNKNDYVDAFEAYSQYLDAPYYVPRYESDHIYIENEKHRLNHFGNNNKWSHTKNSGADLVTLRLKIKKNKLKNVLPSLANVIETDKEKDWYIKFGKKKFSPLKTQFYAGYSKHWNPFNRVIQFHGVKSQGGLISSQRKIVEDYYFRDIWLKYNSKQNKEYNAINQSWKNYLNPFLKDANKEILKNEHGMPLTILDQFSTLYSNIPLGELALKEGASGSMVIDSSFNVIGILNTEITDTGGEYKYIPLGDNNIVVRKQTNGIVLFKSLSNDYKTKNSSSPHIIDGLINKLKSDKIKTIKLNP
ncbi:MAG2960 family serine endopeptidase lipoprotein [Metamycoplasma alkalescens]|nr:DUF31 family protein [Metamycoplasma alkalescens]PYF42660.1 putative peptidase DUF31 [Metamycoplasma alkalescens]